MRTDLLLRSKRLWLLAAGLLTLIAVSVALPLRAAEFDVYSLQHASPQEAKRLLRVLARDRADELHIVFDAETGDLMVRGPQDLRETARQFIREYDRPSTPTEKATADTSVLKEVAKTYQIPADRSEEIVAHLKQSHGDGVNVTTYSSGSRVIVLAQPDVHQQISSQLDRLLAAPSTASPPSRRRVLEDSLASPTDFSVQQTSETQRSDFRTNFTPTDFRRIATYQFQNRDAGEVRKIVERLLGNRLQPEGASQLVYTTEAHQPATLTFSVEQNLCGIFAPEPLLTQFQQLLSSLDQPQPAPGEKLRMIPVQNVEPAKLQQAIDAWRLRDRTPPSEDQDTQGAVWQLDSVIQPTAFQQGAAAGSGQGSFEVVPADPLDPNALRRPTSEVEIQSLPDLDVIILRGRDSDIEELTRIINEIERLSAETTPEIEVYYLQHVRGEALNQLVGQVLQDLTGNMQGRISITPLVKPNALLVIGWGEAVQAVRRTHL